MRILVAFGTRPEIIKLGPVHRALREAGAHVDVFWSGQHIDLADGLLGLFEIQLTYAGTGVMQEPSLAGKFALITQQMQSLLGSGKYDWVVVQGDTMTAAAGALTGFLNHVPVAHVEAGLRTGTLHSPWPEEFNRRLVTIASTLHFAPTERSRDNLLCEGVQHDLVSVVGNTAVDALLYARSRLAGGYVPIDHEIANLPRDRKLVLATLHRRENIGAPLDCILEALRELGNDGDKLILLPVHPNPDIRAQVVRALGSQQNIRLLKPLQYTDFVFLLSRSWTVVTDSGGVQEEAPTFGLPILITRESTERPEVVEAGFGTLVGSNRDAITAAVRRLTSSDAPQLLPARNPFGDGEAARRIAERILTVSPMQQAAE
ncbi:non-hydrolyzing UDP-N-acetylglucosamine 2-epimerase [Bradyrhizobium cenepequi]|uniref:non-hydrolyzing UDP-N-acetylglucosamine 2-epimerase n=1 Tax=Bradyrhizobium cenepequi TaxID=2821403 RepID=UPI001CE337B3|nr:UDP-N-acetylglucosamine 2-epimerase (non-hydrolyzing) [Bradyrhizobium cenepequi]MCA6105874.1 UDP-N-acetylglucosamine 2-epimerase (non-hydrolyzing) [Bradyrhizobium cenepequi]